MPARLGSVETQVAVALILARSSFADHDSGGCGKDESQGRENQQAVHQGIHQSDHLGYWGRLISRLLMIGWELVRACCPAMGEDQRETVDGDARALTGFSAVRYNREAERE